MRNGFCRGLALFCALLPAFLTGCTRSGEPDAEGLWFLRETDDGPRWETRGFTPEPGDPAAQCREVLEALKTPPEGMTAALPETVSLNSLRVSGDVVYVDFSGEYGEMSERARSVACAATVRALLRLPGLFYVSVTSDGAPQSPTYERYCTLGTFVTE